MSGRAGPQPASELHRTEDMRLDLAARSGFFTLPIL